MPPLAAEAAKLIYFSRREMVPFGFPPHHPRTRADALAAGIVGVFPTQEDISEANTSKGAKLVKRIIWDWSQGKAIVPGESGGIEYDEASRAWDCDWWRLRLCWDAWRRQPRWRPGKVYTPGTMSGLWEGKTLISSENQTMAFLSTPAYPWPLFTEATLSITSRPIFLRIYEHHCLTHQAPMAVPGHEAYMSQIAAHQPNGQVPEEGMQNAWFPGPIASLRCERTLNEVTLTSINGEIARYRTYVPNSGFAGYDHDQNSCPRCQARAEVITAALQDERQRELAEERAREVERAFQSVGLGQGVGVPFGSDGDEMDIDEDEDGDIEMAPEQHIMEVGDESNEDVFTPDGQLMPRVRKSHDWVRNVVECDGIEDIVLTGTTDSTHGQAWHHYTAYGRVRPWDGLIGILRVPRVASQGTMLLYGYISGGRNFSGNWRFALTDPGLPAWESAVVMSKREVQ